MNESIYAPPQADVSAEPESEPPFYVVGVRKFFVMSIFTMNLYLAYWFYRNWRCVKHYNKEDIWPVPRGLFYIFFTHSLLVDVNERLKTLGSDFKWRPGVIATAFIVTSILTTIVNRLAGDGTGSPITDLLGVVLVILMPILLLPAQRAINTACEDPVGASNSGLTVVNWLCVILGGLFWLLALFGLYAVFFAPELLAE